MKWPTQRSDGIFKILSRNLISYVLPKITTLDSLYEKSAGNCLDSKKLWGWGPFDLKRPLVVATTTKPRLGHLAPASEVAGSEDIPYHFVKLEKRRHLMF
jgi:hypothetical protein